MNLPADANPDCVSRKLLKMYKYVLLRSSQSLNRIQTLQEFYETEIPEPLHCYMQKRVPVKPEE